MPQYCIAERCTGASDGTKRKRANFNLPGEPPRYCKACATKGMVNVGNYKKCIGFDIDPESNDKILCSIQPTFNYEGKKPEFCNKHKKENMINTLNRKCIGLTDGKKCRKNAYYSNEGDLVAKYCYDHKKENMINKKSKTCYNCNANAGYCDPIKRTTWACGKCKPHDFIKPHAIYCATGCGKEACFNIPTENKPFFCYEHCEPNMIDIKRKRCEEENCNLSALFNYPDSNGLKFCNTHKKDGMINKHSKKCLFEECNVYPSFNWPNIMSPIFCKEHSKDGMINVTTNYCKKCNKTSANFNYAGYISPIFCSSCSEEGMVCVTKKSCQFGFCKTRPSYNFKDKKTPIFCKAHKENGMINVKKTTCLECDKQPNYGYQKDNQKLYCCTHKKDGMIDLKNKMCHHSSCKKRALYNFPDLPPKFCSIHKEIGMINRQDAMCYLCPKHNPRYALYGFPGNKPTVCSSHLEENMVIFPNTICLSKNCDNIAIFGISSSRGKYCEEHSPQDYLCIINRKCLGCNMLEILNNDGYCSYCDPTNFTKNRLARQKMVIAHLNQVGLDDWVTTDTVPAEIRECREGGKFSYRPDILYDLGTHYLIVEVDENQHTSDNYKSCDLPRMINIQQSLALPTIFIRFNPDKYRVNDKIIEKSDSDKLKLLEKWIVHCKNYETQIPLQVIYLFYNEFNETNTELKEINILQSVKKLNNIKLKKLTFKKRK